MENNEYIPIECNYYNYNAHKILLRELPNKIDNYKIVHICAYDINNNYKVPFMRFLLTKLIDEKLVFPKISIFKELDTTIELVNYTKFCLFGLLKQDDFDMFNNKIEFTGFFEYNNNLYMFFDITKCKLILNDSYSNNNIWLALLDEIINHKHLCNISIDKGITYFFLNNDEFCFLSDKSSVNYEIPVVAYVGKPEELVNFTWTFGEAKRDKNHILGPNYYFTDFYNAVRDSINHNTTMEGKIKKYGIVRFAIITGLIKYIENYQNDDIDDSEIKKQRLKDDTLDQKYEILTMRISDHDGNWCKQFNSAYIGDIELDNGNYLKNNQILAVRDYEQQIPLSYHYVDKTTINGEKEEYSII
jgi:hypothetical protein